ncbi:putative Ig domain-containing protein, partial [Cardiobacterium valvarum]
MYGNDNNDILEGKEGKDHLEGGIGKDAYIVKEEDTILDTDNDGEIFFNEKTEANRVHYFVYDEGKKEWYSSDESGNKDGKYIAHREPSSNSLKITKAGGKDSVEIKDYFRNGNDKLDGSLGLETVPEKVEEEPLPPSPEVKEFIITPPAKRGHNDFYLGFDSYQVNGTKYNDTIYGRTARQGKGGVGIYAPMGGGNDLAYGSWYDDVLDGGDDTDIIYGSEPGGYITQKRSRADKDKDGDTIVGGAGSDFLFGMAGKDFIFGGSRTEHEETKPVAGQGDWANGGDGNDHIFGSAAQDVLQGGKGQDEIKGGAGDDLIIGDSDVMPNVKIMRGGTSDGLPTFLHKYNFKTHQMDKPEIYYTVNQLAKATAEWKIEIAANNRDYKIIRSTEQLPELAGERSTIDDLPANSDASALSGSDNDTLEGGPGNDFILGQHGSDFINGGSGNDIIYGDDRSSLGSEEVYYNDHLIGGSGSDYLNGGRGADNYYFIREDFQPEKDGDAVPTDTIDDDGTGNIGVSGGRHDAIYLDRVDIAAMQWVRDGNNNIWNTADGWRISYSSSTLQITHKDEAGKINVLNFANGDYGLNLSGLPNNGGNPPQPDPNPQPQPNPNPPTPPTPPTKRPPKTGKAVAAQRVNEKSPLNFALPDSAFTNPDNVALSYTATLANGKALPKWLHFDAAKRTFSGTPGNDDVGNLSIRVTAADGRGGSAMQNFTLEVVNVNDAPQIGTALANQQGKGGQAWQYRLPANAFRDIDKGDVLTLS